MSELKGKNPAEITDLINRHKGHMILEAGAGTGKTYNLTKRVIHQLTECRVPLERMLALTFTDFAAAEMRSRIYEAINRKLYEIDEEVQTDDAGSAQALSNRKHLQSTRRRFSRNYISTFHSFCNRILHYFPDEITEISVSTLPKFNDENVYGPPESISVEGSFELLSDYDEVLWMLEWKISFYRMYKNHPGLQRQLSRLSVSDFELFMQRLSGIDEAALYDMSGLTPEAYVGELKRLAGVWHRESEARKSSLLETFAAHPVWFKKRDNIPRSMEDLTKHKTGKGFHKRLFDISEIGESTYEEICALGKEMFELQTELEKIELYISNPETIRSLSEYPGREAEQFDANHEAWWNMRNLAELALRWNSLMRFKRFEAGYFNYDDMIWLTHKLFDENPEVTKQMRNRFDQILVDEFQDTDRRQWEIIRKLGFGDVADKPLRSSEKEVLIVGDVKQAIYGFRGGDVSMMGRVRHDMNQVSACSDDLPLKVVPLSYSFRSNRTVIRFVNRLFHHVFSRREKAASYEAHHQPLTAPSSELSKNVTADGEIRVLYADCKKLREKNGGFSIPAEALADHVMLLEARRIARFLREIYDGKHKLYQSIATRMQDGEKAVGILYKRRSHMHTLEQALKEAGLTFTIAKGTQFYQRREVRDAWLLLSFLLDAYDDVSLVGLLRSPMISFSDSGLLATRVAMNASNNDYPNFWSAVSDYTAWGGLLLNESDHFALETGVLFLQELRENVPGSRVSELLEQAFFTDSAYAGGSAGDSQIRENLVKLLDVIRNLESSGRGTLFEITEFLANRIREEARDSEAEQPDPAPIQLMTIHGSKGLQFPMVVIPDMYAGQNDGGLQLYMADDDNDSLIFPAIAYKTGNREGTDDAEASFLYQVLKGEKQKRGIAETKRLFYVAVTRAETHVLLSMAKPLKSGARGSFACYLEPLLQEEPPDAQDGIRMVELSVEELEELAVIGSQFPHGTEAQYISGNQSKSNVTHVPEMQADSTESSVPEKKPNAAGASKKPSILDRNHTVLVNATQRVSREVVTASGLHLEMDKKGDKDETGIPEMTVTGGSQLEFQWTGLKPVDAGTLIHRTMEFGLDEQLVPGQSGKQSKEPSVSVDINERIGKFWRRELIQMGYPDPYEVINQNGKELIRHCRNAAEGIRRVFGKEVLKRYETAFEWTTRSTPGSTGTEETVSDAIAAGETNTGSEAGSDDDSYTGSDTTSYTGSDDGSYTGNATDRTVTLRGSIDIVIRDREGREHIVDVKTGPVDLKSPVSNSSDHRSIAAKSLDAKLSGVKSPDAGSSVTASPIGEAVNADSSDADSPDVAVFRNHAKIFGYDRQIRAYQQAYGAITGKKIPSTRVWLLYTWPDNGIAVPLSELTDNEV